MKRVGLNKERTERQLERQDRTDSSNLLSILLLLLLFLLFRIRLWLGGNDVVRHRPRKRMPWVRDTVNTSFTKDSSINFCFPYTMASIPTPYRVNLSIFFISVFNLCSVINFKRLQNGWAAGLLI